MQCMQRNRQWNSVLLSIATACLLAPVGVVHAFDPPPNDGFVTDAAGVLDTADEALIEQDLMQYREETSNEIAVLIVQTLDGEPIADAAIEAGRKWGVGTKEDNGILLLIAYEDREVFLATGYGLEGAVPDLVAKGIIDEEIIPHFREGDYAAGIRAGVDALKKHIGGEYTADRYSQEESDGAWPFLFFMAFALFDLLAAFLARSKSWWAGGIVGGVAGVVLLAMFGWWIGIPVLVALGLLLDFVLSKTGYSHRVFRGGRGGSSGRRGGGGFGGFGGGSFGGGGASGRW